MTYVPLKSLDSTDNQESLSASVALMGVVVKTIDKELLRSKFSISSQLLLKLLEGHEQSQDASIIRGLLGKSWMHTRCPNNFWTGI